ncbi:MAG: GGDEF domain-containing phosphodiesterase [Alkalibacterium sp.]|nr:GGDEF domain-containing phosphodiesterase [Alkalibacterium sp.]
MLQLVLEYHAPNDGEDVETLLKYAEMAMYHAKNLGKNQYQKYSRELRHQALETTLLANDLYQAIERNEMQLYYQPKVNGLTGEIVGVEALLRWKHPELGFVSPAEFIPLAEKTRLILPIGEWVLKTASKQSKEWQDKGFQPMKIAVNFSVHQLNHPNIVEQIDGILEEVMLEARYLEVEITESLAMDNNKKVKETLKKIKSLGITLSLDDFGKAYSSLNRLRESQVDKVKIDMSFIQGIGISRQDEIIVKAILSLASDLGFQTVAEGVETKEQVDFLNKIPCDQLQGYFFYKPMPAAEMEKLLVANDSNS